MAFKVTRHPQSDMRKINMLHMEARRTGTRIGSH
jgi:hypothetical protein